MSISYETMLEPLIEQITTSQPKIAAAAGGAKGVQNHRGRCSPQKAKLSVLRSACTSKTNKIPARAWQRIGAVPGRAAEGGGKAQRALQ